MRLERYAFVEPPSLDCAADGGGLPRAAPHVERAVERIPDLRRQPVADGEPAMQTRFLDVCRCFLARGRESFRAPRRLDTPDAGKRAEPRRLEGDADARSVRPEPPVER